MALLFEGYSQQNQRRYLHLKDQHGRKWGCNIEIKTGDPTGHWDSPSAPITPPSHALKRSKDPDKMNELFIDYDKIIGEIRDAQAEWDKEAMRLMSQRHRASYRKDMELDPDIPLALGPRPGPVEPWIAAKQGNKWVLGLTKTIDPRLAPFFFSSDEDEEPDYSDEPDFSDLEEEADPQATGGKRVPVGKKKSTKPLEDAA